MAIIGAILGDIAGSQYEFPSKRPTKLDWKYCGLFTDKCNFTDDTVMTLAANQQLKIINLLKNYIENSEENIKM